MTDFDSTMCVADFYQVGTNGRVILDRSNGQSMREEYTPVWETPHLDD